MGLSCQSVYIYVIMSGKYIKDVFQWISVQNGGHLFQNGRNSVIKFKNNLDLN